MNVPRSWLSLLSVLILGLTACQPARPTPAVTASAPAGSTATPAPRPTVALPTLPAATELPADTATPPATETPAATETPMMTDTPPPSTSFNPQDYTLAKLTEGLTRPVFLTHAGDDRLFVLEQAGRIRIIRAGQLLEKPFLDLTNQVGSRGNEQGLLGLAFHPDYADNGYFFVNYTDLQGNTVVSSFTVSGDPDRAERASEFPLLRVDQPYPNHNGGDLAFGPDGYLYIGLGDGGSAGDPQNNAQNTFSLLGKLLRINVLPEHAAYGLPNGNPFIGRSDARPEIWALGLRNPWRFSFDRRTGDLYIADVGQNQIEEVNFQPAGSGGGENYGWRFYEGSQPFQDAGSAPAGLVPPAAEYTHAEGGCAVTGGYVYRGAALPALDGVYLFADYCTGLIWSLTRDAGGAWQRQNFGSANFQVSSFGEDAAGELYLLSLDQGAVYQLTGRR